ncbi:TPA: hypothetical protein SMR42_002399 [Pseudomonas putida]|nr:hypothetical protein [Pseudomonas putida]
MSKQHSFIATLSVDGHEIHCLGESTQGPIILAMPGGVPGKSVEGSRALGYLHGTDEDFAHGREIGTISFSKALSPPPLHLYFRYSDKGYRLYVRGGAHYGQGVFLSASGLLELQQIGTVDPTCWTICKHQSHALLDITRHDESKLAVTLRNADGHPVCNQGIWPVGGHLASVQGASHHTYELDILQRGVDWLSAQ